MVRPEKTYSDGCVCLSARKLSPAVGSALRDVALVNDEMLTGLRQTRTPKSVFLYTSSLIAHTVRVYRLGIKEALCAFQ